VETRQTLFSDVCGTMDELKRLHYEEYERLLQDPAAAIGPLLEDAESMLVRMRERLGVYDAYRAKVRSALQEVDGVADDVIEKAEGAMASLKKIVESADRFAGTDVAKIGEAAEVVRSLASAQEHEMRANKELALELHRLFQDIKADRPWIMPEEETSSYLDGVRKEYQSWLPPEPHSEFLLNRLAAGTAVIVDAARPGGEPRINFQDGGFMAMSQVRWDPVVSNFHPANYKPAPGGRVYRRASPAAP